MAMLVFCALLYMGSEPMETVGIMLTYLVFMRLTIYTQKRKLNFKKLQVFKGMRVFVPVLLIVISLFLYPFAALAIFLLLFMVTSDLVLSLLVSVGAAAVFTVVRMLQRSPVGSALGGLVATAAAAAKLGLGCTIFMGSTDVIRQAPNVARMKALGAEVVAVQEGVGNEGIYTAGSISVGTNQTRVAPLADLLVAGQIHAQRRGARGDCATH